MRNTLVEARYGGVFYQSSGPYQIWKYKLVPGSNDVFMKQPGLPLTCQFQNGELCLWVLVSEEPNAAYNNRQFMVVPTGQTIPFTQEYSGKMLHYISTVQIGPIVAHVFEIINTYSPEPLAQP